jgi:hypothetical protein
MFLRVGLLYLQQSYYESNRLSVAGRSARLRNKLICQEIDCNGPKGQAIHAAASNCIASQFHQQFSMNVMACYTRMKKGAPWLKTTLVQCAWAATRTKGTYLHAQYLRIRSRRGAKKAIGAVAASILTAAYHMLKNGTLYEDLGANHFDKRAQGKHVLQLVNRLKNLGFAVQITPMAA